MDRRYYKEYSHNLGRDMEFMVCGWGGKPLLVIPSQNGRFYNWDCFQMIDNLSPWIDGGRVQLFCVDTNDEETVSNLWGNPYDRIRRHEAWMRYLMEEFYPRMMDISHSWQMPAVTGVSMGAYHAGNLFFRRPDLFDGLIALSGLYDCDAIYGGYKDEVIYQNSPVDFIGGMPGDHPWIGLYNRSRSIICVGQGAWEDELLAGTRRLDTVLKQKGIHTWVDYWGQDVNHDWDWWRAQMRYFLPKLLE